MRQFNSIYFTIFSILFISFSNLGFGQKLEEEKEDFFLKLKNAKSDSLKIELYYKIGKTHTYNAPDSCIYYGKKILDLLNGKSNKRAEGLAYYLQGNGHFGHSDLSSAIRDYLTAINLLEQINPEPNELIGLYGQITTTYAETTDYLSGEEYTQKCIALSEKQHDIDGISVGYNNYGDLLDKQGRYEEALFYYKKSLELAKKANKKFGMAVANYNIGYVHRILHNKQLAAGYIVEAMKLSKETHDTEGIIYNYIELAHIYFDKNQSQQALRYIDSGFVLIKDYDNKKLKKDAYLLKSDIYQSQGTYDSAYLYLKMGNIIKDSIFNSFRQKLVHTLTTNQKIQSLQQKAILNQNDLNRQRLSNQILTIVGVFLFGALLVLFLFNRQRKSHNDLLQQKNTQIEAQKEELTLLNASKDKLLSIISHDLRSPINQVKTLLQLVHSQNLSQNDFVEITQKLQKKVNILSDSLENVLHWANSQLQGETVNKEILQVEEPVNEVIQLYESLLVEKELAMQVNIPAHLVIHVDREHLKLALRNLIANAIKFSHKGSNIQVMAQEIDKQVHISIIDEGVGMSEEQIDSLSHSHKTTSTLGTNKEQGTGIGLRLSKEFIEKSGGKIQVTSQKGKGSSFTIIIPATEKPYLTLAPHITNI